MSSPREEPAATVTDCDGPSGRACIEISVAWGDTTLAVHHLRTPRTFRVGEASSGEDACDACVPRQYLGSRSVPILIDGPGQAVRAVIPPGAHAFVELPGQSSLKLEKARERGLAQPCPEVEGASQVFLFPGVRVVMRLSRNGSVPRTPYRYQAGVDDDLVVSVAWVKEIRWRNALGLAAFAAVLLTILGSAATHAGLLTSMAYTTPPLSHEESLQANDELLHRFYLVMTETDDETADPPPEWYVPDVPVMSGSVVVNEEPGASGRMGDRLAPNTPRLYGNAGPKDNDVPSITQPGNREWRESWFMYDEWYVGDPHAPSSPLGRDGLGVDPIGARGKSRGLAIGDARGAEGLGRRGRLAGANAGGDRMGAVDSGICVDPSRAKPSLLVGVPTIAGPAAPEAIRPVVQQHLARFLACSEAALRERPSLRGRVIVRAVIGAGGQVESVADGGSSLPAGDVVECVVQTFGTLAFPEVKQGPVSVSWPFVVAGG